MYAATCDQMTQVCTPGDCISNTAGTLSLPLYPVWNIGSIGSLCPIGPLVLPPALYTLK